MLLFLHFTSEKFTFFLILSFAVINRSRQETERMETNGQRRGRRKDYVVQYNGKVSTSSTNHDEFDPWTAWAYKPRTITLLFIGACFLM